jgi:ATP-dependent helicase/nuclease subunit A
VLDYKSAGRPQDDAALIEQLARYRSAVQAAYPAAPVQAAFLTGQGRMVTLR